MDAFLPPLACTTFTWYRESRGLGVAVPRTAAPKPSSPCAKPACTDDFSLTTIMIKQTTVALCLPSARELSVQHFSLHPQLYTSVSSNAAGRSSLVQRQRNTKLAMQSPHLGHMGVGQKLGHPTMEPWQVEIWTKTCGPLVG